MLDAQIPLTARWSRRQRPALTASLMVMVARSEPLAAVLGHLIPPLWAINRHRVREFNTSRKPHHRGKRKLKRDQ